MGVYAILFSSKVVETGVKIYNFAKIWLKVGIFLSKSLGKN